MNRYEIIYADPPWQYRDKAHSGKRGAGYKYPVMNLGDIRRLPVAELAAENSWLFLWVVPPQLKEGISVLEAWGFKYRTVGFVWAKTNRVSPTPAMGMGNYTRGNAEFCLLGTRGKVVRRDAGVLSLVISPRREHSRKPEEVRDLIVRLAGDVPRIELFARQKAPGWDAWGNEVSSDVVLREGRFVETPQGGLDINGILATQWDERLRQPFD